MISSLIMGGIGAIGSMAAANTQANAAKSIANQQLTAGQTAAGLLQPYVNEGSVGMKYLNDNLNYLTTPYAPTMAQLKATPGYQFTLGQGLQSTQNAAAARGLGISGAALKGAANYATGLAQNTYAQDAGIYGQQQAQIGNLLTGMVGAGQNAAAGQGGFITGQANNAGQTQMGGATATASGITGVTNALIGAIGNYQQGQLIKQMMAQNGTTSPADIAAMHNMFKF